MDAVKRLCLVVALSAMLALGVLSSALASTSARPLDKRGKGALLGAIIAAGGGKVVFAAIAGEVSVFDRHHHLVARQRVRNGHLFAFELRPGRYLVNTGRRLYGSSPLDCRPVSAQVRPGRTTFRVVLIGCGKG